MKGIASKIGLFLILCLLLTSLSPLEGVFAVAGPYLNASSKTVWVGGKTYDFNVKDANRSLYTISYSVDNTDMASIDKNTGIVTALNVGKTAKTYVRAYLTNKKTGIVDYTLTATLYVKEKASKVEITNKEDVSEQTMDIGDTLRLEYAMYNAAGDVTTKRKMYVTDYVQWTSSNPDVVKVNAASGVIQVLAEGTATITVKTYIKASCTGTATAEDSVEIVVGGSASETDMSAALLASNKLVLTFNQDTSFAISDISVVFAANSVPIQVQSIVYDENDSKKLYVTLYTALADGAEYKVTAGTLSTNIKVSIGTISYVYVYDGQGSPYSYCDISYAVYDKNGVDITSSYPLSMFTYTSTSTADFTAGSTNYGGIYLGTSGTVETLQLVYTSWDFSTGTSSSIKSNVGTYRSVTDAPISWAGAIIANTGTVPDYTEATTGTFNICAGDYGMTLYSMFKTTNGNTTKQTDGTYTMTYASSNYSVLSISTSGILYPNSAGTAVIYVTCGDITYAISITVLPQRAVTTLYSESLTSLVKLSKSLSPADSFTMQIYMYDQYGDIYENTDLGNFTVSLADGSAPTAFTYSYAINGNGGVSLVITANTSSAAKTEYVVIHWGSVLYGFQVALVMPGVQTGYTVTPSSTSVDSYVAEYVNFTVYATDAAGTKIMAAANNTFTVVNASGTTVYTGTTNSGTGVIYLGKKTVNELPAGTYSIRFTVGTTYVYGTFTVSSSRPAVTASVTSTTTTGTVKSLISLSTSGYEVIYVTATLLDATSKKYYVVSINVKSTDVSDSYIYTIPIDLVITATGGLL